MNSVALAAIFGTYVTVLGVVVYFCMMADPHQSPTANYLTIVLPKLFWTTLSKHLGPKTYNAVSYVLDRALLLFYMVIVFGSWSIIFAYVYPWIGRQDFVPHYHRYIGYVVFIACVFSWRIAHTSNPGIITNDTLWLYDHFPYDGLLYESGKICPTKKIPKLARSKFDRHKYEENIPRFDHFCGWVYNAIGEENYRWFLLFLVIHVGMCCYGTYVLSMLFYGEIMQKKLWNAVFFDRFSGEEVPSSHWILFQYLLQSHFQECSVWLIIAAMSIALGLFLLYHVWLTSRGLTTNESYKWDAIRQWHRLQTKKFRDGAIDQDPGPEPVNIYNTGLWDNWNQVLFPKSVRKKQTLTGKAD